MEEDYIHDASQFETNDDNPIIKVIGVGGGGSNAVDYMYSQKIPNVDFVVCNTDKDALKRSKVPSQLILGYNITRGMGAGNKPEIGRQCAEDSADEIRKLFTPPTEMVFITAGMGGGTGTGAAPVVARLAKEAGMLTIGIVTVPFVFEGEKKILKAIEGANNMKDHVDALLVINNQNLVELYSDLNMFNAFNKADDTLANAARSISEIISENLYINVDFMDVKTVLTDAGTAIISTAYGEGDRRISKALEEALHSPLLKRHDIKTARRLLLKVVCSKDAEHPVQTSEIEEINAFTAQLPKSIDVKWGVGDNPELGDKVKVTVLAAGFNVTLREADKKKGGGDNDMVIFVGPDEESTQNTRDASPRQRHEIEEHKQIAEVYGSDVISEMQTTANKMKYAVLSPSQFDDDEIIRKIEQQPAISRTPKFLQELNDMGKGSATPKDNKNNQAKSDSTTIEF